MIATVGTSSHGQGHETAFAMIVAELLGVPMEDVRLVQSDTALVPRGTGTMGSRSLQIGGSALYKASEEVLEQAKRLAAHLLEARRRRHRAARRRQGRRRGRARHARCRGASSRRRRTDASRRPPDWEGTGLHAELDFNQGEATYPFGAHIAVVEVDTETGRVELLRHIAVDDCGRILNPLLVAGQQHGGIAQGVAQALYEGVVYDDDGNPLTGQPARLLDAERGGAPELRGEQHRDAHAAEPARRQGHRGVRARSGRRPRCRTRSSTRSSHLGVRHIDMPLTPERVWRAISERIRPRRNGLIDVPFAAPTLRLTLEQHRTIVAHCYDGLPDEACGLLAGPVTADVEPTGEITAVYPCTQRGRLGAHLHRGLARPPALRCATPRRAASELVGVWHSHTHTDAYPSDTDVRQAVEPGWVYVLVSLKHGEPSMRAYRIRDGAIDRGRRGGRRALSRPTMGAMAVEVRLPTLLRSHVEGAPSVTADGATVGEVFSELTARYPGLAGNLVDDAGALHKFVNVYRNDDDIRYLDAARHQGRRRRRHLDPACRRRRLTRAGVQARVRARAHRRHAARRDARSSRRTPTSGSTPSSRVRTRAAPRRTASR